MNIDFHYEIIYVVARLSGLEKEAAQVVAYACQYVDDATTPGLLKFSGGETFERFASAHKMFDYKNAMMRSVWSGHRSIFCQLLKVTPRKRKRHHLLPVGYISSPDDQYK